MKRAKQEEWNRKRKLVTVIGVVAVLAVAVTTLLGIRYVSARRPVAISSPILSTEGMERLSLFLQDQDAVITVTLPATVDSRVEILIDTLPSESSSEHPINTATEPLPPISSAVIRSALRTVTGQEGIIAYPVALDHVEIAYRRDLVDPESLTEDGRFPDLFAFERALSEMPDGRLYPLVVAGGYDETLLDLLSVLVLSVGGADKYHRLLAGMDTSPEEIVSLDLGGGWTVTSVLDLLKGWREAGFLHPNWIDLGHTDVQEMVQRQIAGAVVMRLSTHRTWPVQILNRIRTSPFPFTEAGHAGTAIIAPMIVASFTGEQRRLDRAIPILTALVDRSFQDTVVRAWRLAPVHSTAETLDRESRDLRFWAAASREILPSLADAMPAENRQALANVIRRELAR